MEFVKATKYRAKARIALDGPSGSGKTYTALIAATVLANGETIAVIDTERGSASLYADKFEFDVLELSTYNPQTYVEAIKAAEKARYSVIVIDSLSHAWEGVDGALEMVDKAAKRSHSNNTYFAWRDVTPIHRQMVDSMLQSSAHIIATMRSKTEYVIEDVGGKQVPKKIGMAPIQRPGMEYEFTIVGELDQNHNIVITKSRCDAMTDAVENKPGAGFWKPLVDWLNSGADAKPPDTTKATPIAYGSQGEIADDQIVDGMVEDAPIKNHKPKDRPAPIAYGPRSDGRPWGAETLADNLHNAEARYLKQVHDLNNMVWADVPDGTSGIRGRMNGAFGKVFADDEARLAILQYVWNVESSKALSNARMQATLDWLTGKAGDKIVTAEAQSVLDRVRAAADDGVHVTAAGVETAKEEHNG